MKNKLLLILTLAATCITLIAGTTLIRIKVPDWAAYRTIDENGLVEFWPTKPYLLCVDAEDGSETIGEPIFWWSDELEAGGLYESIDTGVPCVNWTKSLRRLAK